MKNRYSIGKFSVGKGGTRTKDDTKFTLSEKLALICATLVFIAYFVKQEVISDFCIVAAIVLYFIAVVLNFRSMPSLTKWRECSFVTGAAAIAWTAVPLLQYFVKENQSLTMIYIAISSIVMWIVFAMCLQKWIKASQAHLEEQKPRGKVHFFGWGSKGRRLFVPDVEDGRLQWADLTLWLAFAILTGADKISFIPDFPYKMEVISACAITLVVVSYISYYRRLCPASRWGRSSWAIGMTATALTVVPMILYFTGINDNWEKMWHLSAWSSVLWVTFIFCRYNLYRVRKRAKAEIAMIEWRSKHKKTAPK